MDETHLAKLLLKFEELNESDNEDLQQLDSQTSSDGKIMDLFLFTEAIADILHVSMFDTNGMRSVEKNASILFKKVIHAPVFTKSDL